MSRGANGPAGAILRSIRWFQSKGHVRAAESAFLAVFLGGFYLLAFARVVAPYSRGPLYDALTGVSVEVQVTLTVVGPFAVVVLEWLAGLSRLRERPDYGSWSLARRLTAWLELTTVSRIPLMVYLPLAPLAFVWTLILILQSSPYWPITAAIFLIDVGALVVSNRFTGEKRVAALPGRNRRRG
jgi:hypothetical protein